MSQQVVIKASEVHRAFGKLLKRIFQSGEHLIVERDGFPVAVLLSYQEYERLNQGQAVAAFERFSQALERDFAQRGLTPEALLDELAEAKQVVFQEQYGQPT